MKLIDLTGQRFGRLTIVKKADPLINGKGYKKRKWECVCDCGNILNVLEGNLKNGHTKSCGCLQKEKVRETGRKRKIHGKSKTREHIIWISMRQRCFDKNHKAYKNYGGRGIRVCDRWLKSFKNFWKDMGEGYNDKLTIDRIDVNGNYCKENCKWATYKEQANNKRNNRFITYKGETKTILKWSEETGIKYETILARIKYYNWSIERTLTDKTNIRK